MQGIDAPEKMQALLSGLKKEEAKEEVPNSRPVTNGCRRKFDLFIVPQ